jgi:hypothetical protein
MKLFDVPSLCRPPLHLLLILTIALATKASAQTVIFSDGFENGLNGWLVGDNNIDGTPCYWGIVNSAFGGEGTHGGTNKIYCAAVGYTGTVTAPLYRPDMGAYLLRTLDLTGYTNATLSFWHKLPSVEGLPYDFVQVLVDDTLLWESDSRVVTAWKQVTLSLEAFIGASHTLKFLFVSDPHFDGFPEFEGWYLDDILVTDAFTPGPPPANDNFANSQALPGATGMINAANGSATLETSEPQNGFSATNSVWFRWTAVTNGPVTFSTGGSSFDTILCIYTGNTVDALTPVACDDNGETNNASRIGFVATQGVIYRISVRGANNARGAIQLTWSQPNGIGLDMLPDISLWTDEGRGYLYGWYLDRNELTQPGRTLMRITTATINTGVGPLELIGSSQVAGVYQRIYSTDGGHRDVFAGSFTFHQGHGHLHFDDWLNFHLREVLPSNGVGNIVLSGNKTSFAIIDLEEYDLNLPGAPSSFHYTGGLTQGISVGWGDVYSGDLQDQWIDITGITPGRYWLEAVVDPLNHVIESNESNNVARILADLTFLGVTNVPNDNFTNAIVLTGVSAAVIGSNGNATKEPGEPRHNSLFSDNGGASVWYRWTAPSNISVTITTEGSSFDTVLAVYTGSAVNGLALVIQNDDVDTSHHTSLVTFTAFGGTTYRIAVDGYNGAQGSVELTLNPAWNNDLNRAIQLTGLAGTTSGSTRGATRQASEPLHAGVNGTNSIWYMWTSPTNGPVNFDTIGSSFDTLLAVYTGSAFPLTAVASDDNSGPLNTSRVLFNAVSNTTYRIAVDGFPGPFGSGAVKLNWSGPLPPTIISQPQSTNLTAGSSLQFKVTVNGTAPFFYQWRRFGTNVLDDPGRVSGSTSPTLTVGKIYATDAGGYTVIITNMWGSVTSTPANLIVLDNPRVVYVNPLTAPIGGVATVPVQMQAVGDENSYNFSLSFDPLVLSNPRVTNGANAAVAAISVNTTLLGSGKVGVSVTLPPGQSVPVGSALELARVKFDVSGAMPNGTQTSIGFPNDPTARSVLTSGGASVAALFAPGSITLQNWTATASVQILANGSFQLTLTGPPSHTYVIEATTNLTAQGWSPVSTNQTGVNGLLQFVDPNASNWPYRFFRARMIQ